MPKLPPVPKTFTNVIAERRLIIETPKRPRTIRVQIGAPIQDVPTVSGLDWRCPIRISGHSAHRRVVHAFGVDSLQSLVHALKLIHSELAFIERSSGKRLFWFNSPDYGIPDFELSTTSPNVA